MLERIHYITTTGEITTFLLCGRQKQNSHVQTAHSGQTAESLQCESWIFIPAQRKIDEHIHTKRKQESNQ